MALRLKLFVFACVLWASSSLRADEVEVREYAVLIDGKESGQTTITVAQKGDAPLYMKANGTVKFRRFFFEFNYSFDAEEWWKDNKLVGLRTVSTEQGKRTELAAGIAGNQLVVQSFGKSTAVSPDVWTSSYWKLPDARFHNNRVPILDVESGKETPATLQYVGTEKLTIAGNPQDCFHFKVTGIPIPYDLWFDRQHRMVRQEFVESGLKTVVQMSQIRR